MGAEEPFGEPASAATELEHRRCVLEVAMGNQAADRGILVEGLKILFVPEAVVEPLGFVSGESSTAFFPSWISHGR
jgi:hypothetical protein